MKLLVITSRFPWPLEKGDKLRIYHQLKGLHESHEICLICISDQPVSENDRIEAGKVCSELHVLPISRAGIVWRAAITFLGSRPLQVNYFFTRRHRKSVYQLVEKFKPDHIFCQLIRAAEYVKHIHSVPKTLDYMDAFSKGIERQAQVAPWYLKPIWKAEANRLMAYENLIYEYFEHHVIISEQDQQLIPHPKRSEIKVIPNGVDSDFFAPREVKKEYDVVFVGNMNYTPNADCAVHLVKNIMPLVWARKPEAKVLIAGAEPSAAVLKLASDRVSISGWVEDIRGAYAGGKLFAAPLQIGTGLQNKLLEAMSMSIPCVTSSLANNALQAPSKAIIVRDDDKAFAEMILEILDNEALQAQLGKEGRSFVKAQYSWQATGTMLSDIFTSAKATV